MNSLEAIYHDNHVVISLSDPITIANTTRYAPQLGGFINANPTYNFVLDIAVQSTLDRASRTLFANIAKRVLKDGRQFYLLGATEQVKAELESMQACQGIRYLPDMEAFEKAKNDAFQATYQTYSNPAGPGIRTVNCNCPLCGSDEVSCYMVNHEDIGWTWNGQSLFPTATRTSDEEELDYFSLHPIVCKSCYLATTDIRNFNITYNDEIVIKSNLDEKAILHLSKSIAKRKKMMELDIVIKPTFFDFPRSKRSSYQAFQLADSSMRSLLFNENYSTSYQIGYINYMALKYAPEEDMEGLVDNCRTWLTKASQEKEKISHTHKARSFFILLNCALSISKSKEAHAHHKSFTDFMNTISTESPSKGTYYNPRFWYEQAEKIWQAEKSKHH